MYHATVPVFRHYLAQMAGIVDKAGRAAMTAQIADSLTASEHFATAAGFTLRIACPLAGREVPNLPTALAPRMAVARATLGAMKPAEFEGAADRIIHHRAGLTDLDQSAHDFVFLYGLPNFFFHATMGYASLRASGVPLGKGDFDGFHVY
ncbi:MAG: DUF1993 family protein [Paracoccaceae bacterium]